MRESEQGGRARRTLTARTIRALKPTGRARRVSDGDGLYLLVAPSGSKSWMLRTVVQGRRCDIGLGGASLVTLAEARERSQRLRKTARDGGDPIADKRASRRTVPTFETAAREVHTAHAKSFKNVKHAKQWLASLAGAFKAMGSKRVDAVSSGDILALLTPAWLSKPETSRRVLQRLRVVFDWCKARGFLLGDNPTLGLTKVLPKHRAAKGHHAALPYADVPGFIKQLHEADAAEGVRLALELTILCATRTSETLLAKWAEVDLKTKTWTIPAARMKAAAEHRIPLAGRSIKILTQARATSEENGYVFPGRGRSKPLSNMALLMTLRRMSRSDLTVHGFRSSFRDWAAERTNFPRAVCEAALAHTLRDKTEAAYNRTDLFERRRELMAMWDNFATDCVGKPQDVI
jgi:integrase